MAETIFEATDAELNNKTIWLHIFEQLDIPDWKKQFDEIFLRMNSINDPHISKTYSKGHMENSSLIVSHCEKGERLASFTMRHTLSPAELIELCTQMVHAIEIASKFGFHNYHLSDDSVCVYKKKNGLYHYRLINTGYCNLFELSSENPDYQDLLNPIFMAPELCENKPEGLQTTQYLLGTLLFKAATGYHPCQSLPFKDACHYHSQPYQLSFRDFRKDIPNSFQAFVNRLVHFIPSHRFASMQELRISLEDTSLDLPLI